MIRLKIEPYSAPPEWCAEFDVRKALSLKSDMLVSFILVGNFQKEFPNNITRKKGISACPRTLGMFGKEPEEC